jgi:hypothetical protein
MPAEENTLNKIQHPFIKLGIEESFLNPNTII